MITVVTGPPAAGKSTFVWGEKADVDVVVDFDRMAQALGSVSPHDAPTGIGQATAAARNGAISRVLRGVDDADAWIIASSLTADTIEKWGEQGVKFLVVDPGKDAVLEQAHADGRPERTVQAIEDWYANQPEIPDEYLKGAAVSVKADVVKKNGDGVRVKSAPIKWKADDLAPGQFVGYASVFNNIDSYGDKVLPGAFAESLSEFGEGGAGIPCYWSHRMDDPMMNIGVTVSAVEDERGLLVKVQLDLDTEMGAQVHKLIMAGRVKQMSFAYDVEEAAFVESEDAYWYELRKLKIFEVSVVPVGANQETELLAAKSALTLAKAGRTISATNEERLTRAQSLIGEVLGELEDGDGSTVDEEPSADDDEEPDDSAKSQDLPAAKSMLEDPDTALAFIALARAGALSFDEGISE